MTTPIIYGSADPYEPVSVSGSEGHLLINNVKYDGGEYNKLTYIAVLY